MPSEQWTTGLVAVSTASQTVIGTASCDWLNQLAAAHVFKIGEDGQPTYTIATILTATRLQLSANYAGTGGSGKSYIVCRSFTVNRGYWRPLQGDSDWAEIMSQETIDKIDTEIQNLSASVNFIAGINASVIDLHESMINANANIDALQDNMINANASIAGLITSDVNLNASIAGLITSDVNLNASIDNLVSDAVYNATWNEVTTIAPSKNAVYDQMELRAPKADPVFTGSVRMTLAAGSPLIAGGEDIATLAGVSISNANPSVLTKDATIDDGLSVGDAVIVNSGTNATVGSYIVAEIDVNTSVTLDRQAATGVCNDGNITYVNDPALMVTPTTVFVKQIAFPPTAVPSADPNTLDDYEEGTWTPTGVTLSDESGEYIITGRQVCIQCRFTVGEGNGNSAIVQDLPVAAPTNTAATNLNTILKTGGTALAELFGVVTQSRMALTNGADSSGSVGKNWNQVPVMNNTHYFAGFYFAI